MWYGRGLRDLAYSNKTNTPSKCLVIHTSLLPVFTFLSVLPSRHHHCVCKNLRRPVRTRCVMPSCNETSRLLVRVCPGNYQCNRLSSFSVKCLVPVRCLRAVAVCNRSHSGVLCRNSSFHRTLALRWGKQTDLSWVFCSPPKWWALWRRSDTTWDRWSPWRQYGIRE